jgi:catechol 2,3-dioxygenase-like lactoylglutathione lyase family enzyme
MRCILTLRYMIRIRQLDHIALAVRDVDRSLEFYAGGLGLVIERLAGFRSGVVKFPSVRVNDETIIDLFPSATANGGVAENRTLNHLCLVAAETASGIRAHLDSIGAPIESGPSKVFGARGIGTAYYTLDPDGNTIELRTYSEEP